MGEKTFTVLSVDDEADDRELEDVLANVRPDEFDSRPAWMLEAEPRELAGARA